MNAEAVLENFEDDAYRLIYADYLEEQEDPVGKCLRQIVQDKTLDDYEPLTLIKACHLVFPKVSKLEVLTKKQKGLLEYFQDSWVRVGYSCGGYEDVEGLIQQVYAAVGLAKPTKFIHVKNPIEGFEESKKSSNSVDYFIRDPFVGVDLIGDKLFEFLTDFYEYFVYSKVWLDLGIQVHESLGYGTPLCAYGTFDVSYLSVYALMSAFGLREFDKFMPLMELSTKVGLWWPFKDKVIVTPRPSSITESEICYDLLKLPRRSHHCEQ